jgi:hypothetical protein
LTNPDLNIGVPDRYISISGNTARGVRGLCGYPDFCAVNAYRKSGDDAGQRRGTGPSGVDTLRVNENGP